MVRNQLNRVCEYNGDKKQKTLKVEKKKNIGENWGPSG